jgi:hypothetical protein
MVWKEESILPPDHEAGFSPRTLVVCPWTRTTKQIWRTAEDAATPEMNYYSSNSGRWLSADGAAGVLRTKKREEDRKRAAKADNVAAANEEEKLKRLCFSSVDNL